MTSFGSIGGGMCRPRSPSVLLVLLLVTGLLRIGHTGWRIKELSHWSEGQYSTVGYIVPFVAATDSPPLLTFYGAIPNVWGGLYFYGYAPVNLYSLVKLDTGTYNAQGPVIPGNMLPWAAGDLDGDSSPELIGHYYNGSTGDNLIAVYIPPAGSVVPDSLKTLVRYGGSVADAERFYLTDLDQDGRKEVSFLTDIGPTIMAYEWGPGDSLRRAISVPIRGGYSAGYNLAVGDFDQDGLTEVGTTGLDWDNWIVVYKCIGNDQLVPWDSVPIARPNGHDVFTASNLDGSHRTVFFARYAVVGGPIWLYTVEPLNGTRGYQPFLVDSTTNRGEVYAHSICGDIDGDGLDEILWSTGYQLRVYRCTGLHQYELVWVWDQGSNNSCNLNLYDMNGNGYNEILESGSGVTHIFEIEAIRVLYPNTRLTFHPGDTCRIRWQTFNPPRCDSISLFLRRDTTWTLDTIVTGLAPSETAYTWLVPDIRSDSCRVVAIAYGPGWQYDESDVPFRIAPVGVAEAAAPIIRETRLLGISPNPIRDQAQIRFQLAAPGRVTIRISDVAGRTIATLADGRRIPGSYTSTWDTRAVPEGIYFVRLESPNYRESRKLVLTQ